MGKEGVEEYTGSAQNTLWGGDYSKRVWAGTVRTEETRTRVGRRGLESLGNGQKLERCRVQTLFNLPSHIFNLGPEVINNNIRCIPFD